MDDTNFDDLLKSKLEGYEHPDIGPGALASFHNRMSSVPSTPWYRKYRTEMFVVTSFIVFTMLNSFILWYGFGRNENYNADQNNMFSRQIIDSLTQVVTQLKADQKERPSVFIINPAPEVVKERNVKVEGKNKGNDLATNPSRHTNTKLHLGNVASIPSTILDRLRAEDVLETIDGQAYLIITDRVSQIRHKSYAWELPSKLTVVYEDDSLESEESIEKIKLKLPSVKLKNRISTKMINKIEDHKYTTGIGINLAPHIDIVKGAYSQGSGGTMPRVGLTAEWIVSPHWSVETSLDYLSTKVTVNKDFQSLHLPNLNTELGTLESAEINTRTLSLPINMKYRWWLSQKNQLIVKAGYTPYFSLRSEYLYQYPYPGRPVDSDLSISTVEQVDQRGFYGGTFNMSLGISKFIKKKSQFEVDLFYEKSLGSVGHEKLGMQLFGIRTAYSIRVK